MTDQYFFFAIIGLIVLLVLFRKFRLRSVPRITVEEAGERVRRGEAMMLDVRQESEFRAGHIQGAVSMPPGKFAARLDELKRHGRKELICYCNSGNRSVGAAAHLRKRGLNASSLEGGIGEWNFAHRNRP
jgi:rhodanese-related sulfurtransferase